jgi:hypothetical protein
LIRAYLANGTISSQVSTKENVLALDSTLWEYLESILTDEYCYLVLGNSEVVKVQEVASPNLALVVRGIDGTTRGAWPAGTAIKYEITKAEIADAVEYVGYNIETQYPIEQVAGHIEYTYVDIEAIGGISIQGDQAVWKIESTTELGCINPLVPDEPPDIPLKYYKLRRVTQGYLRGTSQGGYRKFQ